jgi:hypothetical protein
MTDNASPRPPEILRLLVRLIVFAGAIVAIMLIAPTSASASDPSSDLDDPVTDTVTDTADSVETTLIEAAEEPTGVVADTVGSAETTVTEAAEPTRTVTDTADPVESTLAGASSPTDSVANAVDASGPAETATKAVSLSAREVHRVTSDTGAGGRVRAAADAVSTLESADDLAGSLTDQLQEAVSTADPDITSAVEGMSEFATAIVPVAPRTEHNDGTAISDGRQEVPSLRFADERAFTIRAPPVTTGPAWAAATSPDVSAADSSSGWPGAPDLPSAVASSAYDSSRDGSSFNDVAAILVAMVLALGFARWSCRGAELRHKPIFLLLAERPG